MTPIEKATTKHKAPVYLTVERARELLSTRRTETIEGKTFELLFGGFEKIMTLEENAEILAIEQDLRLKRDTHSTILMIACREHPAHAPTKAKGKRKAKEPQKEPKQKESGPLDQQWQPEDDHSPFAGENGTDG